MESLKEGEQIEKRTEGEVPVSPLGLCDIQCPPVALGRRTVEDSE